MMDRRDERRLVLAAQAGDHDAFASLLAANRGGIRVHAWRISRRNRQLCEELEQLATIGFWNAVKRHDGSTPLWALASHYVRGAMLDALRRQKRSGILPQPGLETLTEAEHPTDRPAAAIDEQLDAAAILATLDGRDRQLLVDHHAGRSKHAIAADQQVSVTTCYNRIHALHRLLRERYAA
jgi:RNA polymerase sigma factor (sigma-70 family)